MFNLRVPDSMAALPGRRSVCWDDEPIVYETAHERRLRQMADYYQRNKERIAARRRQRMAERPRIFNPATVTDEQKALMRSMYESGAQIKDISEATGRVYRTVVRTLRSMGLHLQ